MAKILLTGAFGNVGVSTLTELQGRGHFIRCFDLPSEANRKIAGKLRGIDEIVWGDLQETEDVARAVHDMDVVLHIAAIIPPLSETNPELSEAVNVGGTRNLIAAMEHEGERAKPQRLVFCSSVSVFGRNRDRRKLATADEPLAPSDHYSRQKVTCEKMIRASRLDWCILRLNAVMPLRLNQFDPIMFEMNLDGQIEFVHTADVGLALANAASAENVWGTTLLIGGGEKCRYHYREFFSKALNAAGIGMFPDSAFGGKNFYSDWMDTSESQALLHYQRHTYDDYLRQIGGLLSWRKPFVWLLRPFIRRYLLGKSPYYRSQGRSSGIRNN